MPHFPALPAAIYLQSTAVDTNPPLWAAMRIGCSRRAAQLLDRGWPLGLPGLPRVSLSLLLALQGQGWAYRFFLPPAPWQQTPPGLRECLRLLATTNSGEHQNSQWRER